MPCGTRRLEPRQCLQAALSRQRAAKPWGCAALLPIPALLHIAAAAGAWCSVLLLAKSLDSCQENSFCVSLNVLLLFREKKINIRINVITRIGQLAEIFFINKSHLVLFS